MKAGDLVKHGPSGIRGLIISISIQNDTAILFYHHCKYVGVKASDLIFIK